MNKKNPTPKFNEQDGNARPYCISLDWLSVSCRDQGYIFYDREEQPSGYKLVKLDHGSKCFAYLATIYDPEGQLIGELHAKPYNKAMDERCVIVKADNALLYQQDGVEQLFACITALALYYKGINRIDLACDQNEFYGGLLPMHLMEDYFSKDRKILKLGCNHGFNHFDLNYYATTSKNGLICWSKMPIPSEKKRQAVAQEIAARNEELAKVGLPLLDASQAKAIEPTQRESEMYQSVTWGTRGNGVQVQLYNKTKELQEQKLKHYIVDAWKAAGLDVSRNVYRVEIRIHGRGKGVLNLETGKEFEINLVDCLLQEQIEQFFFTYAERHFKFFRNRGLVKLRQNEPITLWHRRDPILKPKLSKTVRNPSRFTLVLLNAIKKEEAIMSAVIQSEQEREKRGEIVEVPQGDKNTLNALTKVANYLEDSFLLSEWSKGKDWEQKYRDGHLLKPISLEGHVSQAWKGSRYGAELYAKIRAKCGRIVAQSKAEREADIRKWEEERREKAYWENVMTAVRTTIYCDYVQTTEPIEEDDSNFIDWDNI